MLLARVAARLHGPALPGEPPFSPGPLPWLGSALQFGRDLDALLREMRREHGDVFTLLVAGQRMTFVLDPLDFPEVLRRVDDLSFKEIADDISVGAFGHSRAPEASPMREQIHDQYAANLKAARLGPLSQGFAASVDRVLAAATPTAWTTRPLFDFVHELVFTAGTDALFGPGTATPTARANFERFDAVFPLLAAGVPVRLLRRAFKAQRWLAQHVAPLRPGASDFIVQRDRLFDSGLAPHDRGHLQLGILWAAQANTIPAVFWTLAHVLADPVAHADLRAEVDAVIAAADGACGREQLRVMTRLDSAVSEALRLASSSLTIRLVRRDTTLHLDSGEWRLRKGDRVCIAPSVTHHDPELYPEPDRYRHDRFIGAQFFKRGKKVGFALMPYGGGVSMCPGRFLAHEDIKHVVARVLHRLDAEVLAPLPPLDQRRAGLGVLPPRGEVPFRLRARASVTPDGQ